MKRIWMVGLVACQMVLCAWSGDVFRGDGGLVVMEAESTDSSLGSWEKRDVLEAFRGSCYLEFMGNRPMNGPAKDPLVYRFQVDKDGVYRLLMRAHKRLEGEKSDKCNDCYVRLKGDFETGGDAPVGMLRTNTKLYGGSAEGWGWTAQLDREHKKLAPLYRLKKVEVYELTVSGRSQRFNIDQIIWMHTSLQSDKVKQMKLVESVRDEV